MSQYEVLTIGPPRFALYLLSGYLKASAGLDQVRWLLAGRVAPREATRNSSKLRQISFGRLTDATGLMQDSNGGAATASLVETAANSVLHLPMERMAVAATICILGDCPFPSIIELEALTAWEANEAAGGNGGVSGFLRPLTALKELFDVHVGEEDDDSSDITMMLEVGLNIGADEERQLERRLEAYDRTFYSIAFSKSYVRAVAESSAGGPIPAEAFLIAEMALRECFMRVLISQGDFCPAYFCPDAATLERKVYDGFAMYGIRSDSRRRCKDQEINIYCLPSE